VQPTHSKSVGILEWVAKENGNKRALETPIHSHDLLGQQLGAKKRPNLLSFCPILESPTRVAHCEGLKEAVLFLCLSKHHTVCVLLLLSSSHSKQQEHMSVCFLCFFSQQVGCLWLRDSEGGIHTVLEWQKEFCQHPWVKKQQQQQQYSSTTCSLLWFLEAPSTVCMLAIICS
jgi:hypothetical protein